MKRMHGLISEDSNQFGPGTDLTLALMAVFLVLIAITSYLYSRESEQRNKYEALAKGGKFKVAEISFSAGTFKPMPVTELADKEATRRLVRLIIDEYRKSKSEFPHILIFGHANEREALEAEDRSVAARLERNWVYAGRRAAVIAGLMQEDLSAEEKERMVVVSTGEFDKQLPTDPKSPRNAWVEVVFAKDWKLPANGAAR